VAELLTLSRFSL